MSQLFGGGGKSQAEIEKTQEGQRKLQRRQSDRISAQEREELQKKGARQRLLNAQKSGRSILSTNPAAGVTGGNLSG